MVGSEVKKIRDALGLTHYRMSVLLGVSVRTMQYLQESTEDIDKRSELAIKALWFGVDVLEIDINDKRGRA